MPERIDIGGLIGSFWQWGTVKVFTCTLIPYNCPTLSMVV